MKKIKYILILLISIFTINIWFCDYYDDFPYKIDGGNDNLNTNIGELVKDQVEDNNWLLQKIINLFGIDDNDWYDEWTSKALYYVRSIINLLLWLVSLISLIMVIYAFYMIFFIKDWAWITKAKQILKWVAIAMVIMWLSRLIVSFIFRFKWEQTQNIVYTNQIIIKSIKSLS